MDQCDLYAEYDKRGIGFPATIMPARHVRSIVSFREIKCVALYNWSNTAKYIDTAVTEGVTFVDVPSRFFDEDVVVCLRRLGYEIFNDRRQPYWRISWEDALENDEPCVTIYNQ